MTQMIDGKALAAKLQGQLAEKTAKLKEETGLVPGLVVILVGENPASQVYVRNKERSAIAAGFQSEVVRVPETITQEELLDLIAKYNQDPAWHGIFGTPSIYDKLVGLAMLGITAMKIIRHNLNRNHIDVFRTLGIMSASRSTMVVDV